VVGPDSVNAAIAVFAGGVTFGFVTLFFVSLLTWAIRGLHAFMLGERI